MRHFIAALLGTALAVDAHVLPTTCGEGSIAANLDFCDRTLSFERRAALLVAHLNESEKLALWSPPHPTQPIARLNVKGYEWDTTCIHGPSPNHIGAVHGAGGRALHAYVTVTAHAINLGASWDTDLIRRVSNMTAVEMRAVTQQAYAESNGTMVLALNCDGGMLANSAHDPRWGRIAETYGEGPYLISRIGTEAVRATQGFVPLDEASSSTDGWLATYVATRHFLGNHRSNEMPRPVVMNLTDHDLYDQYLPAYQSYMARQAWTGDAGGRAEGIMCAFAFFNGVPSCANPRLLQSILRDEWGSEALIQTDCCDAIQSIFTTHWNGTETMEEAVVVATHAGSQLQFSDTNRKGDNNAEGQAAYARALADGALSAAQLDAAAARHLLVRFRLGEFDDAASPYGSVGGTAWIPYLDSAAHRAIARETAAAGAVLLANANATLPLGATGAAPIKSVGCIGAFANNSKEMLHSYTGRPSHIVTIDAALAAQSQSIGAAYASLVSPASYDDAAAAAALVQRVDVAVLVLGLGSALESEGTDRHNLTFPPDQQALLAAAGAAARAARTKLVLLVVSAGPVIVDESQADAILWVGYPGEEAGNGIVDVLWNRNGVVPGGRAPLTWYGASYLAQIGPELDYSMETGVGRTYRYLNTTASPPIFMFGYGLSFSTFRYANLTVDTLAVPDVAVGVTVTNVGPMAASTVAQLYLAVPNAGAKGVPFRGLQGFQKVALAPGESRRLDFVVVEEQQKTTMADGSRALVPGTYRVSVGGHQPGDAKGERESNVVEATYSIPH